jgi:hypothetical protein
MKGAMKKARISILFGFLGGLVLAGCATSGSVWSPLSPVGHYAADDVRKAEKTLGGVTVAAKLLGRRSRYSAQIEIRNDRRKTPVHGPDAVVLKDGAGLIQPSLSAEDLKQEIRRSAASEAAYSLDAWPTSYYYGPRRVYYGRGRYRYAYAGPFYHDDWFERRLDAERILAQADKKVATVDADYLHSQEIPAQSSMTGFLQFAKKPEKGTAAGPLTLSLTVEKRVFTFEFSPLP